MTTEFHTDILLGAECIAEFIFGSKNERRRVYHLAENTRVPIFRLGSQLCARKSTLLRWIEAQESRGFLAQAHKSATSSSEGAA